MPSPPSTATSLPPSPPISSSSSPPPKAPGTSSAPPMSPSPSSSSLPGCCACSDSSSGSASIGRQVPFVPMSKSPRRLALVVAVALAVAACSGTHRIAGVDTLSGPASTTVPPATTAPGPATTVPPCDPTASIRPEGPPTIPANSFIDRIHKRGRLIAGVDQNTYLFGYLNPANGKLEGFDIDMVHQIAKAIFGDENA